MKRIEANDAETQSAHIVADNLSQLKSLFPEAFNEGKVQFETLRQLLGDAVDDSDEKYGLNWHGKRRARQLALTPSTGTLLPRPEDSVDWDRTQNLMIEGDNLEVLKLLQKSYAGKVKLIYIDPPYNTGKDFVYPDNFHSSIENYLELTGQIEGGARISTNKDASGRFHTDWLNMMYPRIKLARNLMRDDGVLIASIDEKEVQNLRYICDDVFGEECFVAVITVLCNPKGRSQDKHFATNHEYLVVYSKTPLPKGSFSIAKEEEQIEVEYPEEDDGGKYRLLELRNTHREFGKFNRKNLHYSFFANDDGEVSLSPEEGLHKILPNWDDGFEGCWTWDKNKAQTDIHLLTAQKVNGRWKIYRKSYANGAERMLKTILNDKSFYTERGQKEFNKLFGTKAKIFQSPKSPYLLSQLFQTVTQDSDLILDFFSGSGTSGHAALAQNAADGGRRRFILVQLPETIDPENKDQKAAAEFLAKLNKRLNISEITKERLRRAASQVKKENPDWIGDAGFRVFRLDASNIQAWTPDAENLPKTLLDHHEHIVEGRREADIVYELLLKLGLDLCVPMESRAIAGKTVRAVGGGVLMLCLAEKFATAEVEALAQGIVTWHKELSPAGDSTVVFRDSAFADDVAKTNMTAILAQNGLENVRTL
jgi:adenine-specific DNA-methyltransferase